MTYILRVPTRGAGRQFGDIRRRHGDVEGIAANDLMHVRRGSLSRIDERIDTIDDCLRTSKSQHGEAAASLARFQVVTWFGLGQCIRKTCEKKSREKHRDVRLEDALWSKYKVLKS
jgi:hypothetical protein